MRRTLSCLLGLAALAGVSALAADDPFVGTWKMDVGKSQVTGFHEEIKDLGGKKYEFKFGDITNTIVADGQQHPNKFGGTWSLKQDSADNWTMTSEQDGKVTTTNTWTLSDSYKKLLIQTKGTRPDGSPFTETIEAKRVGSGSGICGTWESTMMQMQPTNFVIKPYGTDGLSLITPAYEEHLDMKFDGKEYPDHGPRVTPGSTSSGKRTDEHTIEMTDKIKGKVMGTTEMKVSQDGKTLTATVHNSGVDKPFVYVYERQ